MLHYYITLGQARYIINELFFFHVPKVACNATTCSGQGICTDDGVCLCDNGFYADNCSSKFLDLQYSIIILVPETRLYLYLL